MCLWIGASQGTDGERQTLSMVLKRDIICPKVDSVATQVIREHFVERLASITERLATITGVRDMPDETSVLIGGAKETRGAILFVDVVQSTLLAAHYDAQPDKMLFTLNLALPTFMDIVRYYRGEFEKNTGDGILAYFGVGSISDVDAVSLALDAAVGVMVAARDLINPALVARQLRPIRLRVGADLGDFLIAKIGLKRYESPLVAVGAVANRAAKIQSSAKPNEIRVGESFFRALPPASRRGFIQAQPRSPWPFQVRKTSQELDSERSAAEAQRQLANSEAHFLNRSAPNPLLYTAISPNRPYRVYGLEHW